MIDDFHNINVIKTPQGRQLSNSVHMATLLLDVQDHKAVRHTQNIHRNVLMGVGPGNQRQTCKGGICSDTVIKEMEEFWNEYCLETFLEHAPANFRDLNPCILQKSLRELR